MHKPDNLLFMEQTTGDPVYAACTPHQPLPHPRSQGIISGPGVIFPESKIPRPFIGYFQGIFIMLLFEQ
jgi:hypothetical protein